MTPEQAFSVDLYRGTAPYYDRYRPPYPALLLDDLRRRLPISGRGRLLDLACGTGQIARALAGDFAEVVAVDQEPESVALGASKATCSGVDNIRWLSGPAETAVVDGLFELVAVGTAFHRLDRPVVARRMRSWLRAGGGVALLWSDVPTSGDRPWQVAMEELFTEWMAKAGVVDRVPAAWIHAMEREPHELVLRRAGFDYAGKFEFTVELTWTLETLAGFVYSTSVLNRRALGDSAAAFEHALADRLAPLAPDGAFEQSASYAYELARAPDAAPRSRP